MYANLAVITHSPAEFVMDFIQVMPGMPKAKVRSRVVMSPHHVKRFWARWLKTCSVSRSSMVRFKTTVKKTLACLSLHGAAGQA